MKPIAYLDVDDTILCWNIKDQEEFNKFPHGIPATGAKDFIYWLNTHFEVRWLTSWAPCGELHPFDVVKLSKTLDINEPLLEYFTNPFPWESRKTEGIEWGTSRKWVWIEDGLLPDELDLLEERGCLDNYIFVNVSIDRNGLLGVKQKLIERFNLPE